MIFPPTRCFLSGAAAASERVKPESTRPWAVSPPAFHYEEASKNYSGFACGRDAPDFCLLVTDEGREAAFVRREEGKLAAMEGLVVFPTNTKEFDAEGAAADENYFYVVGSHSVKRQKCEDHEDNRTVFRIPVDRAMGNASQIQLSKRLWAVIQGLPELAPYATPKACLGTKPPRDKPELKGRNGLNIEGVAVRNGRLYFGLRGPAMGGETFVVSVEAAALFSSADTKPAVARIKVGEKRAIRDLTRSNGEILALVGPDDDEVPRDYSVLLLEGLGRDQPVSARELAILDFDGVVGANKLKPEAITVLGETASRYRLLVLSDGGENGAPLVFNVPR